MREGNESFHRRKFMGEGRRRFKGKSKMKKNQNSSKERQTKIDQKDIKAQTRLLMALQHLLVERRERSKTR